MTKKFTTQINKSDFKPGDILRFSYRRNGYHHDQVLEIFEVNKNSIIALPLHKKHNDFTKKQELLFDTIFSFEKP
jgi:plasmid maintenance system antidote protein VapI